MAPRKKAENKPPKQRITAAQRADWRTLPTADWNVRTFHAYFADMNRERYGLDYAPMRNWAFEQGALKRAIDTHGPELLRAACEVGFAGYKPTPEYPLLTAGFAMAYQINGIIPRLQAEIKRKERAESAVVNGGTSLDEMLTLL
ncbi:hypothetical protein NST07_25955 [Paenibacillus sp. FSL L8-0340]|uniref:hypothetical protein n=1 Tax=Paenibacillus sp. FSL L8-0340 TaxID=2954685 RepID=UPI00315954CD